MIIVRETSPNIFAEMPYVGTIEANGVLYPWQIVDLWTAEELANIGVYRVEPAIPPVNPDIIVAGYTFQRLNGVVVQVLDLDDPPPLSIEELVAYANAAQWGKATGGYMASIDGEAVPFATTEASMTLIGGKVQRLKEPDPPSTVNWQTGPTSFRQISAEDFTRIASEIADFIQATFDQLPGVFAKITSGEITTKAQIDAAL